MKHIWSILCQNSLIDTDTNNLSINNVLEQLVVSVQQKDMKANGNVNIPLIYEVVNFWVKEDKEKLVKAEVLIEFTDPKGLILKSFPQNVEMPLNINRFRTRFKVQGMSLTISGKYKFVVKVKESDKTDYRIVSEIPLDVTVNAAISSPSNN